VSGERLSIGITTRDRRASLVHCLRSIASVAHLSPAVTVFDDASSVPVTEQLAGEHLPVPVTVIRDDRAPGYIAGRNRLIREATAPYVLLLDDDAALLENGAVEAALTVLAGNDRIGAVAFAQADRRGEPWHPAMQASRSRDACYVPSFIGFAHLVRRDVFLRIGSYRERFEFYGEEKDFGLRLLDAGYRIVYLPQALVVHEPDQAGRSTPRYLRYVTRNDCLNALYNEPLRRLAWLLPARFALYFRMRRAWRVDDPWGWLWIAGQLANSGASVWRERRPVSGATVRLWKQLRLQPERYDLGAAPARPDA
jgi:GT2 family glycosyltransferase